MPKASEATPEQIAEYKAKQRKNAVNNIAVQLTIATLQGGHYVDYATDHLDEIYALAEKIVERSEA